ncbi:hypothetical protein BJ912DRAFT_961738 [Pholiota molesta]|nr:hypothetical protein BJ912DRAFT_961738 [Pholiota molesta]
MSFQRSLWITVTFVAVFDIILFGLCLSKTIVDLISHTNLRFPYAPTYGAPVALRVGNTQHYQLNSSDSDMEWSKLIPSGGHLVYTQSPSGKINKNTVTLFHQFKCLNIIRQQYNHPASTPISSLTHHCMNYLHETLLCRLNTGLESAKNAQGSVSGNYDLVCRDWTQLYKEVERKQRDFQRS